MAYMRISPDNIGALLDSPPLVISGGGGGTVALTASSHGGARVSALPYVATPLFGLGKHGSKSTSSPSFSASLSALGRQGAKANAGASAFAKIRAAAVVLFKGASLASASANLSARAGTRTTATSSIGGKVALAARSAAAAFGKMTPPGAIALIAASFARLRSMAGPSASTSLFARGVGASSASASGRLYVSILAKSAVRTIGRASAVNAFFLIARTFAGVRKRGGMTASANLTANTLTLTRGNATGRWNTSLMAASKTAFRATAPIQAVVLLPLSGAAARAASFARAGGPALIAIVADVARRVLGAFASYASVTGSVSSYATVTGSPMITIHDPYEFVCGDTWEIAATFKDATGNPLDLTGVQSITWTLTDASGNVVQTLSLSNGISVTGDPTRGDAMIKLADNLSGTLMPGLFIDKCRVKLADGTVTTQFEGSITAI